MRRSGLTVLSTIVIIALVVILAGLIYIYSGSYNVAAGDSHTDLMRWILVVTTEESIEAHAEKSAPVSLPADSTALRNGFQAYDQMCVPCHGAPGVERGWMGKGAKPTPPHLYEGGTLMSDTGAEIYWVIRNGIKYTGMPALEPTHDEGQMKEIAAFVVHLTTMDSLEYMRWRRGAAADTSAAGTGHGHAHTH